eukprot:CAMPEP_0119316326 /NCGR_PEP_ID=MMETSP1333-20130426/39412_1 /TAXON_ID=418940 /ORGANISM="Scyphosphaera apsteinii, Strain RCC1455" /LENGTH=126 /DNA_ID=CAMNT_0007321941 /DNA_START=68 /DNA_END=448 /DNA_ORIENTATION=+
MTCCSAAAPANGALPPRHRAEKKPFNQSKLNAWNEKTDFAARVLNRTLIKSASLAVKKDTPMEARLSTRKKLVALIKSINLTLKSFFPSFAPIGKDTEWAKAKASEMRKQRLRDERSGSPPANLSS